MAEKNRYNAVSSLLYRKIQYYQNMIGISQNEHEKIFYEQLLKRELERLENWKVRHLKQSSKSTMANAVEMTLEELAQYNGANGKPAYVAVNGIIYDVSLQSAWGGGTHFNLYAGKDLTKEFGGCHSDRIDILKNLPRVGVIKS